MEKRINMEIQVKANINKLNAEINKLKEETIKYAGENLTKLHENSLSYDDACENCKQIGLKLVNELKIQAETVSNTREELCTALHNQVIPSYVKLIEFEQLMGRNNPEQLKQLITEEVVAELRRIGDWIEIINSTKFLTDMRLSPAKISKRTLSPFLKLLKGLPTKEQKGAEAIMLKNIVNSIIEKGLTKE